MGESARASVWLRRAMFAVAMIGLGTSAFLAWEYARGGTIACPVAGTGCDDVRGSDYSAVLGVPVPWLGLAFYGAFAALEIVRLETVGAGRRTMDRLIIAMALAGVFASGVFTYVEAYVIDAWCFWCLVSAACTVMLLVLAAIAEVLQRAYGVGHEA